MNVVTRLARAALAATVLLAAPSMAALKPGERAPDFSAPAYITGIPFTFKLTEALRKGPVVVYFFPAAQTPGCNLEASLFSKAIDRFAAHHATVIGITAGNTGQLASFSKDTETCAGKFAVAADRNAVIAAKYDALMEGRPGLSSRTSYVISRSGEIVHAYSDSNPNRHVAQTLAAVAALDGK